MMRIQEYNCSQENILIDTHEGYVLSDRKKTDKKCIIAQFINLLLIGLSRPWAAFCRKVIPHLWPIPDHPPIHVWSVIVTKIYLVI